MRHSLLPGQPGLFFQADNNLSGQGLTLGDGIRCCGGNLVRLGTVFPDGNGTATFNNVASNGGVSAGETKCYQYWYRDPNGGPCGFGFNLTNAYDVIWAP